MRLFAANNSRWRCLSKREEDKNVEKGRPSGNFPPISKDGGAFAVAKLRTAGVWETRSHDSDDGERFSAERKTLSIGQRNCADAAEENRCDKKR